MSATQSGSVIKKDPIPKTIADIYEEAFGNPLDADAALRELFSAAMEASDGRMASAAAAGRYEINTAPGANR